MSNGKRRYFPGANTGRGFIGHFEGIVPPWSEPHYTYVLKGGPGVGKSTLMKNAAAIARANGIYRRRISLAQATPKALDAVRIPQRRLVLLDGTAPHTIDPAMPGIDGETLDLGRFLHKEVFKRRREELFVLAEENRAHYKTRSRALSAAGSLRRAAVSEAARSADLTMIRTFLKEGFTLPKEGTPRILFLTSPTPAGVADFREAQDAENTVYLPGVLGAVFLNEAMKLVQNTQTEIFLHPLTPEAPQCVRIGDTMLCAADDTRSTLNEFLLSPLSDFIPFAMQEAETLTAQAVEELRLCKRTHDAIETIYRPFVDYDHVERETNRLLETLKL